MAATLVSKVRALSGSSTSVTTDDQVVDFIKSGVAFIIKAAPIDKIENCTSVATGTSVDSVQVDAVTIKEVLRDNYPCHKEDASWMKLLDQETSEFSLRRPTNTSPAFFIEGKSVYVRPTGASSIRVVYLGIPAITATTSTWEYETAEGPILKYAASMDAFAAASYHFTNVSADIDAVQSKIETWLDEAYTMRTDKHTVTAPTLDYSQATDALNKARDLIDTISGINFEYFMGLDDPEMAASSVNGAASEINRASQELNKIATELRKYSEDIQEAGQYNQDVVSRMSTLANMASAEANILSADVARLNYGAQFMQKAASLYEQAVLEVKMWHGIEQQGARQNG